MVASFDALSLLLKLLSSFFCSRSFKKSEMFSSSVLIDPELAPSPSFKTSDPCCCDEDTLPLPLLRLSSSVLLPPPEENLLRRWPKLLLYRVMGAGFGELEALEVMAVSLGKDGALSAAWGSAVNEVRLRGCVRGFGRPRELLGLPTELPGEGGTAGPGAGDEESEPALKG
jgi:hypothetical protein